MRKSLKPVSRVREAAAAESLSLFGWLYGFLIVSLLVFGVMVHWR